MADAYEVYRRERARYYRTKVIEAEESAARVKNEEARLQFLRVAKGWRGLAEAIEREICEGK